ncbi:hypothetical protein ABQE30_10685 [Enterococcus avium]|uniref:hypothetical protein n=1 Tax=Enterococcus avium TaxID=33945 RepID=UPI0032E51B69
MDYSKGTIEMARLIAENCTSCQRCMKDCLFLQQYCDDPKKLFQQFLAEGLEPQSFHTPVCCAVAVQLFVR